MFDLRYHVASLAAVFLALVIGILIGVGISSGGFVSKGERSLLNRKIDELQRSLDAARLRTGDLSRAQRGATTYVEESYPLLMADRLASRRVALVFVGPVDPDVRDLVERTLVDAGAGATLRMRALRVPVDLEALDTVLDGRPALARYARPDAARELGRRLAQELVRGGRAPVWRLLSPQLVAERSGNEGLPADAVIVARSVASQQGPTSRLLRGFYEGLAASGVPAVGVETSSASTTAVDAFDKASLSSVDFVDTEVGRLALALLLAGGRPGSYGLKQTATDGILPPIEPVADPSRSRRAVSAAPTILIAARDEEARIGETIAALRRELPGATVIVADDGSRDRTAAFAEQAGARVVRFPRRGKGQALTLAEREAPAGPVLLCDADVHGALAPLLASGADLTVAAFAERQGGGFGIAKGVSRALIRLRTGFEPREPLSGQRALSERARQASFPLAAGFGCEVGMTIDALRAGLTIREVELPLGHRATGRDPAGFAHRGRQLLDALLALGPQGVNHRGLRLPLVGWCLGLTGGPAAAAIAATGLADDLWGGRERGLPRPSPRAPNDRRAEARRHPRGRAARHAEALRGAARRARGQPLEPARHETGPRAQGVPPPRRTAARPAPAGRRPAALRLSRDGDARRRGIERPGRPARLEFRGSAHGARQMDCDRRPRLPQSPR